MHLEHPERIVEGTSGTSASFIRELLRRAAVAAPIAEDGTLRVTDRELQSALDDLNQSRESLTHSFLGGRPSSPGGLTPL